MTGERFPFEPLVAIIEARWRQPNDGDGVHLGHIGIEAKTEAVTGMKRGRVRWWRCNGLTLRAADEVAVSLGLHPAQVWPIEWRATAAA
jgi:hypothetical protein